MFAPTDVLELKGHIRYPIPPTVFDKYAEELDTYVRFMRLLRTTRGPRADIRILRTIQSVADTTGLHDDDIAHVLVDLGLRAPRMAYPASFLQRIDAAQQRATAGMASVTTSIRSLIEHWQITENNAGGASQKAKILAERQREIA
jgi:glycine cleavage system protein P-like pyridoxal-binding family